MSSIEISVKQNDRDLKFRKTISAVQSTLDVFESVCAEVRAVLRDLEVSEFEVVGGGASRAVDAEHFAEDVSFNKSCASRAHQARRRLR